MTALDPGRLLRRLVAAGAVAVGAMVGLGGTPASAEIIDNGLSCHGTIAGTSVLGQDSEDVNQAIEVDKNSNILVTMSADRPFHDYTVDLAFGLVGWTVADGTPNSPQWQSTIKVRDYATYGVGLYRVTAKANASRGIDAPNCVMFGLVRVKGQPIPDTVAGDVGAGLSSAGALGLLGAGLGGGGGGDGDGGGGGGGGGGEPEEVPVGLLPPGDDWCDYFVLPALLMTIGFMAMGGGAGGGGPAPARRLRRARWRPRISVVGLVSSVIGGLGVLVVLQQYGKVFPTTGVVIRAGVAAVIVGIAFPSLMRLISVVRYNRRVVACERAMAARPGAAPSPAP